MRRVMERNGKKGGFYEVQADRGAVTGAGKNAGCGTHAGGCHGRTDPGGTDRIGSVLCPAQAGLHSGALPAVTGGAEHRIQAEKSGAAKIGGNDLWGGGIYGGVIKS